VAKGKRILMRLLFGFATSLAVIGEISAAIGRAPPPPFEPDPSGGFSRTVFETDEDLNFKLVIREYSFPPDGKPHTVILPSAAFLQLLSRPDQITIANQPFALTHLARAAIPAGAPIEVVNAGKQHGIVRVLIVEAK
jgi:hypothetical protein